MATAQNSTPGSLPSPDREATSRSKPVTTAPKLRDCCISCATSKVRCPREKPTCSRCAKRKIKCQYLASKRAGRRPDSSDESPPPTLTRGSSIDLNAEDASKLNAALLATTALAANNPNALTQLLPQLSSWFAANAPSSAAKDTSLSATLLCKNLLQSPATPMAEASLVTMLSEEHVYTPLGMLSPPQDHGTNAFETSFVPFLTGQPELGMELDGTQCHGRNQTDSLEMDMGMDVDMQMDMSDAFAFTTSGDCLSSGFPVSPGSLLTDDHDGLSGGLGGGLGGGSSGVDTLPSPAPAPNHTESTPTDAKTGLLMSGSHCDSCLARALDLMRGLFPHPSTFCTTSETGGGSSFSPPTVPAVIERNRQTVEAVSTMLTCPCASDPHLLAIMAHIVFKMMGWYAVAARRTLPTATSTPNVSIQNDKDDGGVSISGKSTNDSRRGSAAKSSSAYLERVSWQAERVGHYRLNGDDSGRMAAQLVLSELHLVQSLVRKLAVKLKDQGGTEEVSTSADDAGEHRNWPFSGSILAILGTDLNRGLKELSVEIMQSLRS